MSVRGSFINAYLRNQPDVQDLTETPLPRDLTSSSRLTVVAIKPPLGSLASYSRVLYLPLAVIKFVGLALALVFALLAIRKSSRSRFVLVQVNKHASQRKHTPSHQSYLESAFPAYASCCQIRNLPARAKAHH